MTWVGGNTTEATTTSLTAVDLITVSALSIAGAVPFVAQFSYRKTSGAAALVNSGGKVNTTIVIAPATGEISTGSTNQAESGYASLYGEGPITNYPRSAMSVAGAFTTQYATGLDSADMSIATITDLVSDGLVGNASITLGQDDLHVYTLTTS